MALKLPYQA